ncbi:hypothetical protein [Nonomuraea sp. KM90]|uniref:hypothetical protein n=1 Tax=Nonomuraea sp. KM90 TaxID=3457428 RepID=UPI003FCE3888
MSKSSPPRVLPDEDFLYSWAARDEERGSCGVTRERGRAARNVRQALATLAPDASGEIEVVRLDRDARRPTYVHGAVVARFGRPTTEPDGGDAA